MKIDIKIKNNKVTCVVEFAESTPIYKFPHNRGRIIDYGNYEALERWQVEIEILPKEIPANFRIESFESGPKHHDNKDNTNLTATWVYNIKSLTNTKRDGKIKTTARKQTSRKTK